MSQSSTNTSAYIAENFGANASYVEGLYARFQADPNSVDESWRDFFGTMLNGGNGTASQAAQQPASTPLAEARPSETPAKPGRQSD